MIMGVAYGVDRWQDICCPFSAGSLQWRVKESGNGAGNYLTGWSEQWLRPLNPIWLQTLLHQQPQSLQLWLPRPQNTLQTSLLINISIKILSFSKQISKSCHRDWIILAAPAPTPLVSRVFSAQWWYLKMLSGSFDLFQDSVIRLKTTCSWSALGKKMTSLHQNVKALVLRKMSRNVCC